MNRDDVIKFIDGKIFYYSDYINFLYEQLQLRDEIIKEIREFAKLRKEMYERQENIIGQEAITSLLQILDKENNYGEGKEN